MGGPAGAQRSGSGASTGGRHSPPPLRGDHPHLGSPVLAVNVANGVIVWEAEYGPFGERTVIVGEEDWMGVGFAGGVYYADTGLVRFGARDYDPSVGRWMTKDPSQFDGSDDNLYEYASGDPVNAVDATGRFTWVYHYVMCVYYEISAADAFKDCEEEYRTHCGADMLSESCVSFCDGQPRNPTDDVRRCVARRDRGAFQGMLRHCTRFVAGWTGGSAGATRTSSP